MLSTLQSNSCLSVIDPTLTQEGLPWPTDDIQGLALEQLVHVSHLVSASPLEDAHQTLIDLHHMLKAMPADTAAVREDARRQT